MNVILGGRRSGKTAAMLDMARQDLKAGGNPGILVHSISEAERLRKENPDLKDNIQSWQASKPRLLGQPTNVYVDNAEFLISHVLGIHPYAVSLTGEGMFLSYDFDYDA